MLLSLKSWRKLKDDSEKLASSPFLRHQGSNVYFDAAVGLLIRRFAADCRIEEDAPQVLQESRPESHGSNQFTVEKELSDSDVEENPDDFFWPIFNAIESEGSPPARQIELPVPSKKQRGFLEDYEIFSREITRYKANHPDVEFDGVKNLTPWPQKDLNESECAEEIAFRFRKAICEVLAILCTDREARALEATNTPSPDHKTGGSSSASQNSNWANCADRKMKNPEKYPHMNCHEVMAATGLSKSAVYDHPSLERVNNRTRKVLFKTKSVINILASSPE